MGYTCTHCGRRLATKGGLNSHIAARKRNGYCKGANGKKRRPRKKRRK